MEYGGQNFNGPAVDPRKRGGAGYKDDATAPPVAKHESDTCCRFYWEK